MLHYLNNLINVTNAGNNINVKIIAGDKYFKVKAKSLKTKATLRLFILLKRLNLFQ
jgi:hypothetical protein